ncbi:MAG TPA: hypothetical protein VMM18_04185 [Gemmatimonadaceae bacterium]|nr:hypothetical protein [Gemmatimonadaceae bacterium]
MNDVRRGLAMADRVAREAAAAGVDDAAVERLRMVLALALERRHAAGMDEEHPDYLHPARTALILIEDAQVRDGDVLAAALMVDSVTPALGLSAAADRALGSERVAALFAELPAHGLEPDERREALVVCGDDARRIALAERLDHARHLHFRDRSAWRSLHESVVRADLPVAEHYEPALARRLRRWADAFGRRRLRDVPGVAES